MRPSKFIILFFLAVFFSFSPKVFASTFVNANITENTTWILDNSPYIVQNNIRIASAITLTINPGVIVKFDYGSSLSIKGIVNALGTSAEPIYFTSIYNDARGGDTNGDGEDSLPSRYDDWDIGIYGATARLSLSHAYIEYSNDGLFIDHGALDLAHTSFREAGEGIYSYFGNVTFDHVSLSSIDDDAFSIYSGIVEIKDSVIEDVDFGDALGFYNNPSFHAFGLTIKNIGFGSALGIYGGTVIVEGSAFEGGLDAGIEVYDGSLNLHDSRLSGYLSGNFVSYRGVSILDKLKIENTDYGVSVYGGTVTLSGSAFKEIFVNAVENYSASQLDARQNFWGDVSGPYHKILNPEGLGASVYGDVLFDPWLTSDPFIIPSCCSNVLFLPGIKGSVLEKNSDTLWPPTPFSLNDVNQLALTSEGKSINDVHTDGILNKFLGTSIYAPFSSFMDGLVTDGTIEKWLPLAYDWRFSPETILTDGIKTKNETINVIEEIEKLAANSKTKKVTIVAHSMGGLLGKAIIKKLQDEGKDNLIDSFVMVAAPQLGTPQAIASILHGDDEGIAAGFIVNPISIRRIAQNMPGAYNLLPSSRYFTEAPDPVIKFNESALFTQTWRDFWGMTLNTYSSFLSFMTGTGVTRAKPVEQELQDPEVLSPAFMTNANNFHNVYDDYQFPEHIRVVQVAGWGSPTVKAVNYKNYHGYPSYETLFTREGDRAVVYPSAISSVADETYFFDIFDYNDLSDADTQHRDLLNVSPIQNLIELVLKKQDITENSFISNEKPALNDIKDQLLVSTHSPVILGAYDQSGNFTGIDPNQNLSADILSVKEDIPGSAFLYTAGGQNIFLPKNGNYNFIYQGTGVGPTTVTIQNFTVDTATTAASYTDIPTIANTKAAFTVESVAPANTEIALDYNGDGTTDEIISPDDGAKLSLNELMVLIKSKISGFNLQNKIKQNLLKQITNLEKKIENKRRKNTKIFSDLSKKISRQEMKGKINAGDAAMILNLLNLLEAQSENLALDPVVFLDLKTKIQSLSIKTKNDLLKRVENLGKKQMLIKTLSNISKNIIKKSEKGKIADEDAQAIIDLLNKIMGVI